MPNVTVASPAPPGSGSVTTTFVPTGVLAGPVGAAIVHWWTAGLASTLPDGSVATAVNVCGPSGRSVSSVTTPGSHSADWPSSVHSIVAVGSSELTPM